MNIIETWRENRKRKKMNKWNRRCSKQQLDNRQKIGKEHKKRFYEQRKK